MRLQKFVRKCLVWFEIFAPKRKFENKEKRLKNQKTERNETNYFSLFAQPELNRAMRENYRE